jgi:hypothetical protein
VDNDDAGDEVRAAGDDKGGAPRRHVEPGDEERLERGLQPAGGGHQAGDEASRLMRCYSASEFPLRCTILNSSSLLFFFAVLTSCCAFSKSLDDGERSDVLICESMYIIVFSYILG